MLKFKTILATTGLFLITIIPGAMCYATTTASTSELFPNPSKISTIKELLEAIINFVYANLPS